MYVESKTDMSCIPSLSVRVLLSSYNGLRLMALVVSEQAKSSDGYTLRRTAVPYTGVGNVSLSSEPCE